MPGRQCWKGASRPPSLGIQCAASLIRAGKLVGSQRAAQIQLDSKNASPPCQSHVAVTYFPTFGCCGEMIVELRGWREGLSQLHLPARLRDTSNQHPVCPLCPLHPSQWAQAAHQSPAELGTQQEQFLFLLPGECPMLPAIQRDNSHAAWQLFHQHSQTHTTS